MVTLSVVVEESCEVVSSDVDEVNGGTKVRVVSVAVDWTGVVWAVVVSIGVVVGNGIVVNDPMVRDVVRSGVCVVRGVEEVVVVVDARVKSFPMHSFKTRLPRCASLSNASAALSTVWHEFSTSSSICLTPAMQEREQVSPLVKSAVVQP